MMGCMVPRHAQALVHRHNHRKGHRSTVGTMRKTDRVRWRLCTGDGVQKTRGGGSRASKEMTGGVKGGQT